MTVQEMKQIIDTNMPFNNLKKDSGIYIFYEDSEISIGISYESYDELGNEINDRYIYNLFYDNEYINIPYFEDRDEIINELFKSWNDLEN